MCVVGLRGWGIWRGVGGRGDSTQSRVSTVKLIEKAVAVNLHTEGAVTFPIALHLEVMYKIRWLQ